MAFNLVKETEKVKFVLAKKQVADIVAAIAVNLDISGSMKNLYERGVVQQAMQQILPVALNFDDNGQLDVNPFSDECSDPPPTANADNYTDYVERHILQNRKIPLWGGTLYKPVLDLNLRTYGFYGEVKQESAGFWSRLFSKSVTTLKAASTTGYPAIIYHITDGENGDKTETEDLIRQCEEAKCNIYFLFMGIGGEQFSFLRSIANKFSNAGFVSVADLAAVAGTDEMYELLLPPELISWLRKK